MAALKATITPVHNAVALQVPLWSEFKKSLEEHEKWWFGVAMKDAADNKVIFSKADILPAAFERYGALLAARYIVEDVVASLDHQEKEVE